MKQIIEASKCLKNWWDRGLIMQQPYTPEDNGSDDCQVEDESGSIVGLPGILFRLCHNREGVAEIQRVLAGNRRFDSMKHITSEGTG
jgi:hypothetical protein